VLSYSADSNLSRLMYPCLLIIISTPAPWRAAFRGSEARMTAAVIDNEVSCVTPMTLLCSKSTLGAIHEPNRSYQIRRLPR
jgi:hypothetical protein